MTPPIPGRPTVVMSIINTVVEDIVRILCGLVAMAGGGWAVGYEAKHPPAVTLILIAGLVAFAIGFCLMPGVFQQVQKIVIFVVPYIPLVGGRRAGDPPKAP